jgi:membrane protease YdiL (CAAX protease family)
MPPAIQPPGRTFDLAPARAFDLARARNRAFAVSVAAVLATYNNVVGRHPWHNRWYVPLNAGATGAVLAAAVASGLTSADLGLGPGSWRLGRAGTGWTSAVAAGWLLIATVPASRPVLADKRSAGLNGRGVAYQAAVRIPVGTVLWEEVAFRGVLQASLRRVLPVPAAIAVTSGVFGLWHIRPTWQALRTNNLTDDRRQAVARVSAVCAGMAASGALLSWLRERSGGLAAPIALHLVTNSGGAIAAYAVKKK